MTEWMIFGLIYGTPLALILGSYLFIQHRKNHQNHQILNTSISDGLTEAMSLHPVIDPMKCLGCGSCVSACPEKKVLGLVNHKAQLIQPSNCIGHGACKTACPENAISLVFGSKTRGVEIPEVKTDFQSSVSGIYIAGELGGMGLIRNAIEQGRQAMESIVASFQPNTDSAIIDCVIVGSGPAGLTAALGAQQAGLNYVLIEQETAGGTIAHFPKGKLVMTQSAIVPMVGKVNFGEISKEDLMQFWTNTITKHGIIINEQECLLNIEPQSDGNHLITTTKGSYTTQRVLLAIGRRGTPRKLNIPGEDLPKVVYRMCDPAEYLNKAVFIVGGGDSAIEAACSIAELKVKSNDSYKVSLSYRKETFARVKAKNREWINNLTEKQQISIYFSSTPEAITTTHVKLKQDNETIELKNDAVIICAGGILPTGLLNQIGVKTDIKYGQE